MANIIDFVIYHHPCADGTGSALVVWKYMAEYYPEKLDSIIFWPTNYNKPPPDVTNRNVIICDFSYKKDVLETMIQSSNSLIIIDHHKSAEKELLEIDSNYKIFDINHSGCTLTWNYFFKDQPVPLLLQYIEDRDIWTKKLPNTDAFTSWFFQVPITIEEYSKYLDDSLLLSMIEQKGIPYEEQNNLMIKKSSIHAYPAFCKVKEKYYFVAYLNTTVLKSDIGHQILHEKPFVDFSAVYDINDWTNTTSFSLRSSDQNADVSEIATTIGGGGHRNASGVRVPYVTNRLPIQHYNISYDILNNISYKKMFINNKTYNIVTINTNIGQKELSKYLLQTKYTSNKNNIQQASHIMMTRDNLDNIVFHIAIAWFLNNGIQEYYIETSNLLAEEATFIKNYIKTLDKKIYTLTGILDLFINP